MADSRRTVSDVSEIKSLLQKGLEGDCLEGVNFEPRSETFSRLLASFSGDGQKSIRFVNCGFEEFSLHPLERWYSLKLFFENCSFRLLSASGAARLEFYVSKNSKIESLNAVGEIRCGLEIEGSHIESILFSTEGDNRKRISVQGPIKFINCKLGQHGGEIIFRNVEFKAPLSFNASTFYVAPQFFSAEIHEDTDFINARFLDTSSRHAMRAYRALKQRMSGFHAEHEEYLFHRLELESRFKTILPRCYEFWRSSYLEMVGSGFLGLLNRYGQNFWLPVLWLMYMAWAFHSDQVSCGADEIYGWLKDVCDNKRAGLLYTIRNAFGPFGLILSDSAIQPNTLSVKILGFIHLLISSVIWFIWILQIRSRFKL